MKIIQEWGKKKEVTHLILLLRLLGIGLEYVWKDVEKISDIDISQTIEPLIYNLPLMNDDNSYTVYGMRINWEKLYGKLESGEYEFIYPTEDYLYIRVKFIVNDNGEVTYDSPTFN